jgi:subtilisin family serine protease
MKAVMSTGLILLISLYATPALIADKVDQIIYAATGENKLRDASTEYLYSESESAERVHDRLQLDRQALQLHQPLRIQEQSLQSLPVDLPNAQDHEVAANTNNFDRYIVALREGSSGKDRLALIEELRRFSMMNQEIATSLQVTDLYNDVFMGFSISVPKGDTNMLKVLQNNPRVAIAEKDQQVRIFAQTLPTGVNRVDGDLSVAQSGNGQGIVDADIAIMDTGVDLNHPDLNVFREKTFVGGTVTAEDDNGHGTHIAGIAAAKDNNIGTVGIAPGARIWAVKVLDNTGTGFISDIIAGIDYLTQNADEVDVVNMSFACECSSSALDTALNNSVQAGIVYVAAAGNSGKNAATFSPANNAKVIAVSAIVDTDGKCGALSHSTSAGGDDTFASFSNFGSVVDLAAPGTIIYSTFIGDSYATMSGTSMASPHVAGAATLLTTVLPTATPAQIKSSLTSSGSASSSTCDGNGRGYFSGDPDQSNEPLIYLKSQAGTLNYVFATQTNNFVNIKSYYDVMFRTSTPGTIKKIGISFPAGTYVGSANLIEVVGIGTGKISASGSSATGQMLTYTINSADNVATGTNIRLQFSNIVNPPDPSAGYHVTVTTKNSADTIIDGPTQSHNYLIKSVT